MHEMRENQRAQEHWVDKVSVQKLREIDETIQQLTSQLQQMQEQMNYMNDSGDFQDVESNYSGRLCHVSSQTAMIPSSRSLLSREKRLPLDTCAHKPRSSTWSRKDEDYSHKWRQTKSRHNSNADICSKAVGFWSSTKPVELPQNYVVGQQRQQISELQFDKFPNPQSFLVWKIRFKTQVTACSDFPSDAMLWINEVEMVASLDELKSLRSVYGKNFSKLRDAGREDCLCSEQDHPEFPFQEEGRSVSSRKTDRLHDLRLFSSNWRSWYSIGLCWFILCYSSWWQCSGIRYKMGRSSSINVKNSIRWYLGKSVQIDDTWVCATQNCIGIVRHGDSAENMGAQLSKIEDNGEEEKRSETSITKLWR